MTGPRRPRWRGVTAHRDEVHGALADLGISRDCRECGHGTLHATGTGPADLLGVPLRCVTLTCDYCGHLRLHDPRSLGLDG